MSKRKSPATGRRKKSPAWHQPRKVENYWKLYKKDTYVAPRPSGLPGWLLPLLVLLVIVGLIFWIAPTAVKRLEGIWSGQTETESTQDSLLYTKNTWAVKKPVADLYGQPDLKASRLGQALYNEPVYVQQKQAGLSYAAVRLSDGSSGYMLLDDLVDDRVSLEPAAYAYKAIVVSKVKRIMSHANQGSLLAEVMMGTTLYIDYRGAGVSRLVLPGGEEGWISDDGVAIIAATSQIEQPFYANEAFCNTASLFLRSTVLENGISVDGISLPGLIHVAGKVNGINLPRRLADLQNSGSQLEMIKDAETGLIDLADLAAGDLLFLSSQPNSPPDSLALYLGQKQILYARPAQSSIRSLSLLENIDLWQAITMVRRIFQD